MAFGILPWLSETGNSDFPLSKPMPIKDFIVDANFIQFDNYVPTLKTVKVYSDSMDIIVQFDKETITSNVLLAGFTNGQRLKFTSSDNRYLGKLTLGSGATTLWGNYVNQTLAVNIPFVACTVQSIPSTAGLYSLAGVVGSVNLNLDDNMFIDVSGQDITFNAVSLNFPGAIAGNVLKTLNSVAPIDNTLFIESSSVIKFEYTGGNTITFNLIVPDITTSTSVLPAS